MDDETKEGLHQLAKKALQNQAHIMTILRLLAIKRIITIREFDEMYDRTLKELKEDVIKNMLDIHDRELTNLTKSLGRL